MTDENGTDDSSTEPDESGSSDEPESDALPSAVSDQIERQRSLREAYLAELEAERTGDDADGDGGETDSETGGEMDGETDDETDARDAESDS